MFTRADMYELATTRLYLRPLASGDLLAHHRMVGSDPQVTWHGQALTLNESQRTLDKRIQQWQEHGFGMWAMIDKDHNLLLGHCGLHYLEQTSVVELGYYLGRSAWGKGYASKAGQAALRYDLKPFNLRILLLLSALPTTHCNTFYTDLAFSTSPTRIITASMSNTCASSAAVSNPTIPSSSCSRSTM